MNMRIANPTEEFYDTPYDPLQEAETEEDFDTTGGQQGPCTETQAKMFYSRRSIDAPPRKRIQELFSAMPQRRKVMIAILKEVDEPRSSNDLDKAVEELQKHDFSVYTGQDYTSLLGEAGAIMKVSEDGSDYREDEEQEPEIVEIDGELFYRPRAARDVFWVITDDGRDFLASDRPLERLAALLEDESPYRPIYKTVLEICNSKEGCTTDKLIEEVAKNPLAQKPFRHGSHFAKKLEDCDALEWQGSWKTTEIGLKALEVFPLDSEEANGAE